MGILCKGSLNVVVSALGPLKTSLLTSTKGNILSAFLSWRDSCTHSQLMHMFNLCMLCFFLLCINDYLHLFLLDFMIASCVENIIAFRLLGCILFDFVPLAWLHVGCNFWGCALVHQRRSTSAAHRRKSPSGAPLVVRWCGPAPATSADRPVWRRWTGAGGSAWRPALKPKLACALVLRWSTSAGPPAHRVFFWRVFKTTSLHLWPLYIC